MEQVARTHHVGINLATSMFSINGRSAGRFADVPSLFGERLEVLHVL